MVLIKPVPAALMSDFRYCQEVVRSHRENFPVGSILLPAHMRRSLHAVYAFARQADDFADLPGRADEERLRLLDDWSRRLALAASGRPDHPIFRALAHTFQETGLTAQPLNELLVAFRMDVTNKRYDTIAQLEEYCRYSAHPVGRMVLHFAGVNDPEVLAWSDDICTALQLTNHWQDLGQDPWKGRPLYLPREEMDRFGVDEKMVLGRRFSAPLGELMLSLVEETRRHFEAGRPLLRAVRWPFNLELALVWEAGMVLLDRIEGMAGNTLRRRPTLDTRDWLGCLLRAAGGGRS
ncbi:MAG: squalene synthase HpnC [Magnetococcales bacterium]|nr:squalene synthase HpnC [Magnetococcales bacterium]